MKFFSFPSIWWRCIIAHDVLEYNVLPGAEKLENKIQKKRSLKYKILEEELITPLDVYLVRTLPILAMTMLHFSYYKTLYGCILSISWLKLPFGLWNAFFRHMETLWVNLPTPCYIYRFNQPSWKIHGIV